MPESALPAHRGRILLIAIAVLVTIAVAAALAAYVGLLVRLRNQALERQVKLRYLPRGAEYDLAMPVRRVASR